MDPITRNEIFLENQDMIRRVMRRNWTLIHALRLEPDDVYQELAIAALRAIESFDSMRSDSIRAHIWMQLQYAVLDLRRRQTPYGLTAVGKQPGPVVLSWEYAEETGRDADVVQPKAEEHISPRLRQALSQLDESERVAVIRYLENQKPQRNAAFRSAMDKIRCYYLAVMPERRIALCVGELR